MKIDTSFIDWDGGRMGFLLPEDWDVLEGLIDEYGLTDVMEFGSGISTRLFCAKGVRITSYEQDQKFIAKIKKEWPNANMRQWDGRPVVAHEEDSKPWHLIFVDGPWCPEKPVSKWFVDRRYAYELARHLGPKFVACHDSDRDGERSLIEKAFGSWEELPGTRIMRVFRNPKW